MTLAADGEEVDLGPVRERLQLRGHVPMQHNGLDARRRPRSELGPKARERRGNALRVNGREALCCRRPWLARRLDVDQQERSAIVEKRERSTRGRDARAATTSLFVIPPGRRA